MPGIKKWDNSQNVFPYANYLFSVADKSSTYITKMVFALSILRFSFEVLSQFYNFQVRLDRGNIESCYGGIERLKIFFTFFTFLCSAVRRRQTTPDLRRAHIFKIDKKFSKIGTFLQSVTYILISRHFRNWSQIP